MLAADIISSIDTSYDPCDDFYNFASEFISRCRLPAVLLTMVDTDGGWLSSHEIPAGKSTFGSFNALAEENERVVRKILDSDISTVAESTLTVSPADEATLKKLRGLYGSCMNETVLNELGEEPMLHFVQTLRNLYNGETLEVTAREGQRPLIEESSGNGLTTALAFLHTRGKKRASALASLFPRAHRAQCLQASVPSLALESKAMPVSTLISCLSGSRSPTLGCRPRYIRNSFARFYAPSQLLYAIGILC